MDKNKLWKWMLLGILVLWSLTLTYPLNDVKNADGSIKQRGKLTLGLDLKGGSSFVVEVDAADVRKKMAQGKEGVSAEEISASDVKKEVKRVQEIAVEVIRNRIDNLGTAEPEIYPEGDSRIVVRLPGIDETTRASAKQQILSDAVLNFKLVHIDSAKWVQELKEANKAPKGYVWGNEGSYVRDASVADEDRASREELWSFGGKRNADFMLEKNVDNGSTVYRPHFIETRKRQDGDTVKDAYVDKNPNTGARVIALSFDSEGKEIFGNLTKAYGPRGSANKDSDMGRQLGVVLDDELYSAPNINEPILGGRATISGSFSAEEARRLANALRAGSLPGRVEIVEERTVAPTLGEDSIKSGKISIAIGAGAVLLFMFLYYRFSGMVANLSLVFVLFLLPCGMVLASGFLGVFSGSLEGGSVGLPTLTLYGIAGIVLTVGMAVDANVLIFERMREEWAVGKSISGAINSGYNKAFSTILDANVTTLLTAIILFVQGSGAIRGFAVTLSAGILVSMFIVLVITRLFFNTMADAKKIKSLSMGSIPFLAKANFDFVGKRKLAAMISLGLIIVTWGIFASKGNDNLGVDFKGGSVMTFTFDDKQEQDVVEDALAAVGFDSAQVSYQTEMDQSQLLEVKIGATGAEAEPALEAVKKLPGNYVDVKTDSVGSQIGSELKVKGMKSIIFALIGIIIYISMRFEFSFAMGAIVALVHDVLITVGVYCALGNELSMPIIAALLTIVGYSVNDTIVVFDRIREDLKLEKGKSYKEIANLSINQTLSRTFLTSFTTLLTVVMLLIFGGGSVADFALALLIGIVVGTYSSIFVATPVVLMWHKEEKVK